ncbi:MAG TPA: SpoIID/LytB domain-containing protein [Candidatus Limnocylindrales bacterium]|nr:SpoIID/LytB domain-containing protein [Candidatus Limnocylindrales bacterium]
MEDAPLPSRTIRRVGVITALAALAFGAIAPASVASAADRTKPPVVGFPLDVTFYGRGWGHGVGMSQHGARGRALAGQAAPEILAHYFAGTALGSIDPATPVRVLLLDALAAKAGAPLTAHGRGGDWSIEGLAKTFPANAKLTAAPVSAGSTNWNLSVVSSAGAKLLAMTVSGGFTMLPGSASTTLQLDSKPSSYDTYRGRLRVKLTTTARVINDIGLDAYLRGVVPIEMPSSWPAEALRAQSIAARSYAVYRLHPGSGSFDLYDDTRSQVYRGAEGEKATTDTAIVDTAGKILKSGSSVANAMFHSTGGGATENNEFVFVSATGKIVSSPVSYLRGSPDRAADGTAYDAGAPYATWQTGTYTKAEIDAIFNADSRTAAGSSLKLDLSRRGVSGRLISVTLTGTLGSKTVSGDVFRAVFNANRPDGAEMRSTLVDTRPIP